MSDDKQGPLTRSELLALWESAVDPNYSAPLVAAGDGNGLEAINQACSQLERASLAIDKSLQAMYILPSSGQTNPPAAGEEFAQVTLTFTRTKNIDKPLHLLAGTIYVDEQLNDWGVDGGISVQTGRRYVIIQDVFFFPGDPGPRTALATAEFVGSGYNNPLHDTLVSIDQPGTNFFHDRATFTVQQVAFTHTPPFQRFILSTVNEADTLIPAHVGQYIIFTAGSNTGKIGLVIGYTPPDPVHNIGAVVDLEPVLIYQSSSISGSFPAPGEEVILDITFTPESTGRWIAGQTVGGITSMAIRHSSGTLLPTGGSTPGNQIVGTITTFTAHCDVFVLTDSSYVSEAPPVNAPAGSGANWRVMDWVEDWGLTVTNTVSPTGGLAGMLDTLGGERNVNRGSGEGDDAYRARVATPADVVSPNAIRRAIVKQVGSRPYCLREVGSALFPGFYYDRTDGGGDFYDDDTLLLVGNVVTPGFKDPHQPNFDEEPLQYRDASGNTKILGWFGKLGDTGDLAGWAYDNHPRGLYDTLPPTSGILNFYDGTRTLYFIRKYGYGSLSLPLVVAVGDTVLGLHTGGVFSVQNQVNNPYRAATRFHTYLDYASFRAFFLVGLPRADYSDFGFAWGNHTHAVYDATNVTNAYDGFPIDAAAFYKRVYQAVNGVRAGGVRFDLYQEDGTCS